jgi:SAM-dependent methyltransferase
VLHRKRPEKLSLNGLVNVRAYEDERWLSLFDELGSYSYDHHIFNSRQQPEVYRKGWEWTQTIYGLEQLDMVRPEHTAIGVGAGRECVIYWLADRLARVVATDLYGNEKWSAAGGVEADAAVMENPQAFCPRSVRLDSLEFRVMDGTDLSPFHDNTFDIAWSLSSIEHFGGHERAADAVREMARVVRPGGVVVIATEFLLLDDQIHPEFFNRNEIDQYIVSASPHLELVEPINWSMPPVDYLIDSVVAWDKIDRTRRHVVINDGENQWTSILLFFRNIER